MNNTMPKLEIVCGFERLQKHLDILQKRLPELHIEARSSFFVILGCYVEPLSDDEKTWLQAMIDAQIILRYRCKMREDR